MLALNAGPGGFTAGGAAVLAMVVLYTDGLRRQIPHWTVGGLALLWIVGTISATQPLNAATWGALACGAVGLTLGYLFHHLGWLGGGDGKLLGVLALWLGPGDVGLWLLSTAVLGLLLIVLALIQGSHGDFRVRGIPFAWAMVPPASALLFVRALAPSSA